MIIQRNDIKRVDVYLVTSKVTLHAGIDSGRSLSEDYVIAYSVVEAMSIVEAFYTRDDDFSGLTFDSIVWLCQAQYVPQLLAAKGKVLRGTDET